MAKYSYKLRDESIDITLHYTHMFPSAQKNMAEKLNMEGVGCRIGTENSDRWKEKTGLHDHEQPETKAGDCG